jgi:hypothetical protein
MSGSPTFSGQITFPRVSGCVHHHRGEELSIPISRVCFIAGDLNPIQALHLWEFHHHRVAMNADRVSQNMGRLLGTVLQADSGEVENPGIVEARLAHEGELELDRVPFRGKVQGVRGQRANEGTVLEGEGDETRLITIHDEGSGDRPLGIGSVALPPQVLNPDRAQGSQISGCSCQGFSGEDGRHQEKQARG